MINIKNVVDQKQGTEKTMINELRKKDFFDIVYRNEIDFKRVSDKKKDQNEDFHKFNIMIKKLKKEKKYTLIEVAIFLSIDLFKEKTVIECFNEENYYTLRCELSKKYDTGMEFSILEDFLI
jgi:hypothetical protein